MTPPPPSLPWLERLDWLHGLARRIVRDECAADDLTQQVVLKALRADRADAPQRWWAHVMRNAARDEARSTRHRREREGDAASRREGSPAHSVVSDAEMQGRVAEAVLALGEPYRTVLLLRYFQGLPPRAIAKELGRPVGTVKSQLERARDLLRAQLRDEFGGSAALSLGLLPIAGGAKLAVSIAGVAAPVSTAVTALGGALTMKLTLVLPVLLLALLGAWLGRSLLVSADVAGDEESVAIATLAEVDGEGAGGAFVSLVAPAGRSAPSTRISAAPDAPSTPDPIETRTEPTLRGVALDLEGRPLPSLELALMDVGPAGEYTTTDETGHFEFQRVAEIEVIDPALAVFVYRNVNGLRELRIARTVLFAGRVVDKFGNGLPGVSISDQDSIDKTGIPDLMKGNWFGSFMSMMSTDAEGYFDLRRRFTWPGRSVTLMYARFGTQEVVLPSVDTLDAEIVFENVGSSHDLLIRVLDEHGEAATDAVVLDWAVVKMVDSHGEVVIRIDEKNAGTELIATRPGYTPVHVMLPNLSTLATDIDARTLVVDVDQLGGVIRGQVLDADGDPVEDATIGVWHATRLGMHGTAESLVLRDGQIDFVQHRSGPDGRFTLEGLSQRPHTIRAVLESPLRVAEARNVLPGTEGLRLQLPAASEAVVIEGRVVDALGEPIAGASVTIEAPLIEPHADPRFEVRRSLQGARTRTDDAGRFRFDTAFSAGTRLLVKYRNTAMAIDASLEDPTIVLDVACTIDVTHTTPTAGRTIVVLGEDRAPVKFSRIESDMIFAGYDEHAMSRAEASTTLSIPQSARTIVLTEDGREVARVAVRPDRWKPVAVDL